MLQLQDCPVCQFDYQLSEHHLSDTRQDPTKGLHFALFYKILLSSNLGNYHPLLCSVRRKTFSIQRIGRRRFPLLTFVAFSADRLAITPNLNDYVTFVDRPFLRQVFYIRASSSFFLPIVRNQGIITDSDDLWLSSFFLGSHLPPFHCFTLHSKVNCSEEEFVGTFGDTRDEISSAFLTSCTIYSDLRILRYR